MTLAITRLGNTRLGNTRLENQVVVITGGSRGLGKAMAIEFQRAGAQVVISARHVDALQAAAAELPQPTAALALPADVRDLAELRALAAAAASRFGRIDIWVNNAGLSPGWGKLDSIDPDRWRESFDTNAIGTYNGCRAAIEQMLPNHRGQIINILGAGADKPAPNQSAYGTAKAAVAMLTRTLAIEYAGAGITLTAVMPGMIWTEMLTRAEGVPGPMRARMEWAMRIFGNPPPVPARFVVGIAARGGETGKTYRLITPRVFLPRMLREALGGSRNNPRPWQAPG